MPEAVRRHSFESRALHRWQPNAPTPVVVTEEATASRRENELAVGSCGQVLGQYVSEEAQAFEDALRRDFGDALEKFSFTAVSRIAMNHAAKELAEAQDAAKNSNKDEQTKRLTLGRYPRSTKSALHRTLGRKR